MICYILTCRKSFILLFSCFFLTASVVTAQTGEVSGAVRSATDDQPLSGVTIQVKGSSNTTATDAKGHYVLKNISSTDSLLFSYTGFKTEIVSVNGLTEVNMSLQVNASSLNQVVVIGFGTTSRRELTGAVSSVKAEDLQKVPSTSFTGAIQGKVPGVFISHTSGAPGGSSSVRIRGVGTTGGNEPLYVIDGVPIGGGGMSTSRKFG